MTREDEVLLKIARAAGPYRSAILSALDIPVAQRLVSSGLAHNCTFDDWFNLTDAGSRRAQHLAAVSS